MSQSFFHRHKFTIVLVVVFLLPFIWMGTRRALKSNRNDVKEWLPEGFQETVDHQWFMEHFPHEQFVLISWEGCTLDDPRLELFARKLDRPQDEASLAKPWLFKSVLTGRRLMDELQRRYENLSEEEILQRLEGSLIGKNHSRTCLVVTLSEAAKGKQLRPTLAELRRIATEECGIPADTVRLGGPPVDNVAIDVEGERTLYRLAGLSALVGLGISMVCFRSVRLTAVVFWTAILAAGLGLAIVFFSGSSMDAILLSMPSLVYVLAISGAIHIVNYYHDAIHEQQGLAGAADRAVAHAWYPCTIAALTTALGLGSLMASNIIPISKFGLYSAAGVMATLLLIFFYLPALLEYFPSRKYAEQHAGHCHLDEKDNRFIRMWRTIGGGVVRHNKLVAIGCLAVMVFFAAGVFRIETSVKLMKLFSPDAEIIHHYAWLEEHLGPLVPMEVVIRIDNEKCRLSFVERMRLAQDVERAIEQLPDVGGALSAATFAPDLSPDTRRPTIFERAAGIDPRRLRDEVLNKRLQEHRKEFREYLAVDTAVADARGLNPTLDELGITSPIAEALQARKLDRLAAIEQYGELKYIRDLGQNGADEVKRAIDAWRNAHGEELWRVSARVWALTDLDYGLFVGDLKQIVEPVLAAYREQGVEGVSAAYTGLVPLVYKTQHELLKGLVESLILAFAMIALVMMFVLRSFSAGLLAMIPNLFPVVVIFGAMGWMGVLVDVGTMMTASVALGVAVDDTIHYLAWYRVGLDLGLDRKQAAMEAYERCATAMTQTTLIGGLGLVVFAFSTFTPTQRFGTIMLTLLAAALFGDLIFLPSLLTGPVGRFFKGRGKRVVVEDPSASHLSASPEEPQPHGSLVGAAEESQIARHHHRRRDARHQTGP